MTESSGESQGRVTELLADIRAGESGAGDELLPLVYDELRKLARARMAREMPGHTLQPTALVHEAYLRLIGPGDIEWDNRGHFFAAAAEAMRRILIDSARRKSRQRHGGELRRTSLRDDSIGEILDAEQLIELDRALTELEAMDAAMAEVVKLRYFAGLTIDETAAALDVSPRSVNRLWTQARAWLHKEMSQDVDNA